MILFSDELFGEGAGDWGSILPLGEKETFLRIGEYLGSFFILDCGTETISKLFLSENQVTVWESGFVSAYWCLEEYVLNLGLGS